MKQLRYLLLALAACLFAGCEVHTSDNGDLDGYWQMTQLDSLASGKIQNMKGSGIFYAVYVHLFQVQGAGNTVTFRFKHEGDSLFLSAPYVDYGLNDQPLEDVSVLRPYGINNLEEKFCVEALSKDKMILKSKELRIYFRKY